MRTHTDGKVVTQEFETPLDKITHLSFPFMLNNVPLGKSCDINTRIKAIAEQDGLVVALRSKQYDPGFVYVVQIRVDPADKETFYFRPINAVGKPMRKEEKMHYWDLDQLMSSTSTLTTESLTSARINQGYVSRGKSIKIE